MTRIHLAQNTRAISKKIIATNITNWLNFQIFSFSQCKKTVFEFVFKSLLLNISQIGKDSHYDDDSQKWGSHHQTLVVVDCVGKNLV